jgi:hypothetical protein
LQYQLVSPLPRKATEALLHAAPDMPSSSDEALLALACPGPECRVVVMAPGALELTCSLLHRGYRAVTMVRPCERVLNHEADLVIVPQVTSTEMVAQSVACARRILRPRGTIVLRLAAAGAGPSPREAMPHLTRHGFMAIQTRVVFGAVLMRGELPAYGRLTCA